MFSIIHVNLRSHPETESIATETTDQKPDEFLSEESATISSIQGSNGLWKAIAIGINFLK